MPKKWNLQDIKPVANRTPQPVRAQKMDIGKQESPRIDIAPHMPEERHEAPMLDQDLASIDIIDGNREKKKRVIISAIIVLCIVGVGYMLNVMIGGAEVTIRPKVRDVSLQAEFTAYKSPQVDALGYELLTLDASGERQVKAAGKETVALRAEGKIFVYNLKSTTQRLVKNTRFESKDGLIFKIKESIEVPPATKNAQGETVAGSVTADVFADGVGEQYNVEPGKFVVFLFKGTPDGESIYAESTTAFSGGFEGEKYTIDEGELATAKQELHLELRNELLERLKKDRPAGFVVYDNAVTFAFNTLPAAEYGDSLATIKESARLQVPIFKEDEFAKFVAGQTIPDYDEAPVTLTDPYTFKFTYVSATATISDIAPYDSLTFTLEGGSKVVWEFDEKKVKSELLGMKKADATKVFSAYPAIGTAEAEISPFWVSTFPDSPEEITIHTVLEEKK